MGEHEQCARALASALCEERILRGSLLELYDTMRVHASIHVEDYFDWNAGRLRAKVHYVLHATGTGDGTSRRIGPDSYEHVAGEERLKSGATANEREERKKILAAQIELDPTLRARLGVNELPGSIAERRHVGVVHLSSLIHNEGDVQSASGSFATLAP